mmetsp:Transcript_660/g.1269  ORF Transcript_660/g.1269 Transcript_660/m.1269 type:complete len:234 (-) Transcript_660:1193-1894(-)
MPMLTSARSNSTASLRVNGWAFARRFSSFSTCFSFSRRAFSSCMICFWITLARCFTSVNFLCCSLRSMRSSSFAHEYTTDLIRLVTRSDDGNANVPFFSGFFALSSLSPLEPFSTPPPGSRVSIASSSPAPFASASFSSSTSSSSASSSSSSSPSPSSPSLRLFFVCDPFAPASAVFKAEELFGAMDEHISRNLRSGSERILSNSPNPCLKMPTTKSASHCESHQGAGGSART